MEILRVYDIVNIIVTASLGQEMILERLGLHVNISYSDSGYRGRAAYFRSPGMKGTVSIFSSGKMISAGTRSIDDAVEDLEHVKSYLANHGIIGPATLCPQVQNLVATLNLGNSIRLERLAVERGAVYEPEQFPGAILRVDNPFKCTLLLFQSGKAVITGLKSTDELDALVEVIDDIVRD